MSKQKLDRNSHRIFEGTTWVYWHGYQKTQIWFSLDIRQRPIVILEILRTISYICTELLARQISESCSGSL